MWRMTGTAPRAERSAPSALRIVHAITFLGFASAAMAATHQELFQLWRALAHPYHSGTPPHPIACVSGVLASALGITLLTRLCLGRRLPLPLSAALLLAFLGSLSVLGVDPKARTVPGANVKCLERAKTLHQKVNEPLQKTGQVPAASTLALEGDSPFYARPFTSLAWHVEAVERSDRLPLGSQPGWLLLEAAGDGASFVITAVGIDDEGGAALLRHEGKPIEYRGAYNPDTVK
jgi:hypothetical protein